MSYWSRNLLYYLAFLSYVLFPSSSPPDLVKCHLLLVSVDVEVVGPIHQLVSIASSFLSDICALANDLWVMPTATRRSSRRSAASDVSSPVPQDVEMSEELIPMPTSSPGNPGGDVAVSSPVAFRSAAGKYFIPFFECPAII